MRTRWAQHSIHSLKPLIGSVCLKPHGNFALCVGWQALCGLRTPTSFPPWCHHAAKHRVSARRHYSPHPSPLPRSGAAPRCTISSCFYFLSSSCCTKHSVRMCDNAWEVRPGWQPALSPTSILSLTPVSSLATCQLGWGPPQWHIGAKTNFITCRCGLQSWGNTRESVPHCHSWSSASPAAVAGQHAAFSEPSAADATSGKAVVTSCQSTAQHRRSIVSPWRQQKGRWEVFAKALQAMPAKNYPYWLPLLLPSSATINVTQLISW